MEQKLVCSEVVLLLLHASFQTLFLSLVAGMDYSSTPVPDPVVFPTNSTEGMELCAEIMITDDSALEGEHNFTVNISSTSPEITLGDPYEATIVIQDNDGKKKSIWNTVHNIYNLNNNCWFIKTSL